MKLIRKLRKALNILRLSGFRYFRASQLTDKNIVFTINNTRLRIIGASVLTMLLEIVSDDIYHLKKQVSPKIIFDVGANVGVFSLYAATLFPESEVYAFEPAIENYDLLVKNTSTLKNIHCFNKAISNYDGKAYVCGDKDNTAFTTTAVASRNMMHECETITLQTFLLQHTISCIDILKLDCEGAEYDIAESDLGNVKQIVGEYHTHALYSINNLKSFFSQQNFNIKQWQPFPGGNAGIFWIINKRYNN